LVDFPAQAKVMVMPSSQPRPESDRLAQLPLAVLGTPLTVAADVVITPIAWFAWTTGIGFKE
jgi:hypothetical protein